MDIESPPNSLGISEGLDRSFNFSEVFQLVKKSVKNSLGKRRTGLMLGLADLRIVKPSTPTSSTLYSTNTCTRWDTLTRARCDG